MSYWHLGSHIGPMAYMALQCQYDLEAHLGHIITFLLHRRNSIISVAPVRPIN